MFNNIGKKIKGLAIFVFVLGVIVSVLGAIVDLAVMMTGIGVILLPVGIVLSWISVFFIYGFGELIERAVSIDTTLRMEVASSKPYYDIVRDKKAMEGVCEVCRQFQPKLWVCIAKEGARYTERKVCPNCINVYKNFSTSTEHPSTAPTSAAPTVHPHVAQQSPTAPSV